MRLVQPEAVTPASLISSNVPEDDYPAWAEGEYKQGERVIYEHRIYEVLAETTADKPPDGLLTHPPSWLDVGATNRWRMFDDKIGTQTKQLGSIDVDLRLSGVVNSIAVLNAAGRSITVRMTDPIDGVVYERETSLVDAGVTNWYDYYFAPIPKVTDIVLTDLPAYGTADLQIEVSAGAEDAAVGHVVIGRLRDIGVALHGTSVGIIDYSRKTTDEFGNTAVVERGFSKRAEFDVVVDTEHLGMVQRLLASIRATPVLWIGEGTMEETILFGFFKDFNLIISGPSVSDCSITVEGLA